MTLSQKSPISASAAAKKKTVKKTPLKKKTPSKAAARNEKTLLPKPLPNKTKKIPFFNRELSWLEFNARVLQIAQDESLPIFERLKFLSITASNLDEFAMVRLGSMQVLTRSGREHELDLSGVSNSEMLGKIRAQMQAFMNRQYEVLDKLDPILRQQSIRRYEAAEPLPPKAAAVLSAWVTDELLSVLTPMSIQGGDLPLLKNLGLYMLIRLAGPEGGDSLFVLPLFPTERFVSVHDGQSAHAFIAVEDVVRRHIDFWFPGQTVLETSTFRLTRNADFAVRENELPDLILGMEEVIALRQYGFPVRLEAEAAMKPETLNRLLEIFDTAHEDAILIDGPLDLSAFMKLAMTGGFDALRDEVWEIYNPSAFPPDQSIFPLIAKNDRLIIQPYESFDPVVRLVEEAAEDPNVLAIKQILYRSGSVSRIIDALIRAAERRKSVTVVVELKARFDEERNIDWARKLEHFGIQVIYGIKNYKTHAKICMVVRREQQGIVRYMHFATGNYNAATAKLYSDVGFFTAEPAFGEDATHFFNTICGITTPMQMNKLIMAPLQIRERIYWMINKAIESAKNGLKTKLTVKVNSLCDGPVIERLYAASRAGVKIRLNVRGVCMLKPGLKGWSSNIRVVSIVDKFLEHARIIALQCGSEEELWISSADWMPRNLSRRIELMIPIENPVCMKKLSDHLETFFRDNTHAWNLNSDGKWVRLTPGDKPPFRAQWANQLEMSALASVTEERKSVTFEPHRKVTPKG